MDNGGKVRKTLNDLSLLLGSEDEEVQRKQQEEVRACRVMRVPYQNVKNGIGKLRRGDSSTFVRPTHHTRGDAFCFRGALSLARSKIHRINVLTCIVMEPLLE